MSWIEEEKKPRGWFWLDSVVWWIARALDRSKLIKLDRKLLRNARKGWENDGFVGQ